MKYSAEARVGGMGAFQRFWRKIINYSSTNYNPVCRSAPTTPWTLIRIKEKTGGRENRNMVKGIGGNKYKTACIR